MPRPLPEDHVRLILAIPHGGLPSVLDRQGVGHPSQHRFSRRDWTDSHVRIKDDPKLPQLRRVKLNRTPLNPDGRTDVERELLEQEKMERENEFAHGGAPEEAGQRYRGRRWAGP